jgi:AcrR family transcriptional regulator
MAVAQDVLSLATDIVARHGYEALTYNALHRASGTSPSTILSKFGSKEGLLLAICERHVDALLAAAERADLPEGTTRLRLDRLAQALVTEIERAPAAHKVLLIGQIYLPPERQKTLRRKQRWMTALFASALEAALPRLAHDQPALTMPAVLSLLSLLNHHVQWFHATGVLSRGDYARFAVTSILHGVRQQLRSDR